MPAFRLAREVEIANLGFRQRFAPAIGPLNGHGAHGVARRIKAQDLTPPIGHHRTGCDESAPDNVNSQARLFVTGKPLPALQGSPGSCMPTGAETTHCRAEAVEVRASDERAYRDILSVTEQHWHSPSPAWTIVGHDDRDQDSTAHALR